jgi:hypothetical protein
MTFCHVLVEAIFCKSTYTVSVAERLMLVMASMGRHLWACLQACYASQRYTSFLQWKLCGVYCQQDLLYLDCTQKLSYVVAHLLHDTCVSDCLKLCCADSESWSQTYAVHLHVVLFLLKYSSEVFFTSLGYYPYIGSIVGTIFYALWQTICWNSRVRFTCIVANLCVS